MKFESWFVHNVFAHPLMELCKMIGFSRMGEHIHDMTIPYYMEETAKHEHIEKKLREIESNKSQTEFSYYESFKHNRH